MKHDEEPMGKFSVEVEFANNIDVIDAERGLIEPLSVRRKKVAGVIDSGAAHVVLPTSLAQDLGLQPTAKVKVRYADRRAATRDQVENVWLELLGRHGVFKATLEPMCETALIGAIVLEDLDLLIDCRKQCLYPRDPKFVVSEIE